MSEYQEDQFTEDGHFGFIDGCNGRVVHYVENRDMVCDGPCEEEIVQPVLPLPQPEPEPVLEPITPIAQPDPDTDSIPPIAQPDPVTEPISPVVLPVSPDQ